MNNCVLPSSIKREVKTTFENDDLVTTQYMEFKAYLPTKLLPVAQLMLGKDGVTYMNGWGAWNGGEEPTTTASVLAHPDSFQDISWKMNRLARRLRECGEQEVLMTITPAYVMEV